MRFFFAFAGVTLASALLVHYVSDNVPLWPHAFVVGGVLTALGAAVTSASDVRDELEHLDDILDE